MESLYGMQGVFRWVPGSFEDLEASKSSIIEVQGSQMISWGFQRRFTESLGVFRCS